MTAQNTGCDDDRIWRDVPVEALRVSVSLVTTPTVAEIAGRLTKAQREALLAARFSQPMPLVSGRWEVQTPRIWKALIDKKLAYASYSQVVFRRPEYDRAVLNGTGEVVRAYLQEQAR